MTHFETWIANCLLGHRERDGKFRCQAEIWADSHGKAIQRLAGNLDPQGYHILWVEACLRAHSHGGRKTIRGVHEGRTVVLGPVSVEGASAKSETYLHIEEIEGVEPLDAQFGAWPLKAVPDALMIPLFGQVAPTEADMARYGEMASVPPMKTYAILDAAKVFGLADLLEVSGLACRCLFKGDSASQYRDVAPYLVELKEGNSFTTTLFTYLPDRAENMTSVHMWHKEPGIYVRSRASFDEIWKHFRKFTRIQDEDDKWYFFRFWEPDVLKTYLRANASNVAVLHRFAGHPTCPLSFLVVRERDCWRATVRMGDADENNPAPIRFTPVDQQSLAAMRWRRFQENLMLHVKQDYPEQYTGLGENLLLEWSNEGRERGFRIEKANYNWLITQILCYGQGQTVDDLISRIPGWGVLSELDRSYELLKLTRTE